MTDKQKLARIRNFTKRRILGIIASIKYWRMREKESGLTYTERVVLKEALSKLEAIIQAWDSSSKILGLKPVKKLK